MKKLDKDDLKIFSKYKTQSHSLFIIIAVAPITSKIGLLVAIAGLYY